MTSRITTEPVASAYTTEARLPVVTSPYADEPSMPASATGTLFVLASGFGIGALVILAAFAFLIGIGDLGQHGVSPATPATKSAANAPAAPGPAPKPAPNTAAPAVPSTTGQAPAPANPQTPKAPTVQQQNKQ
jgi:hypothetical protein